MENRKIIMGLVDYFAPEALEDESFTQYLTEHLDSYFDWHFMEDLNSSIGWRVRDKIRSAFADLKFMNDSSHPVYLDANEEVVHFGEYVVPAYWYKKKMGKEKIEDMLLQYKRIWEKLGFGEILYPLMQDWNDLTIWRQHYSEDMISRMEKDLEAKTTDDARSLYYLYSRRADLYELERTYPDKIKEIFSIENRAETEEGRTADVKILLWDDSECFVRVGTNRYGRYCSTTALSQPGFPMFTDNDERRIQRTVFDHNDNNEE